MLKRLHYWDGRGFGETACGRSLHSWQGKATPIATNNAHEVECKLCLKALGGK